MAAPTKLDVLIDDKVIGTLRGGGKRYVFEYTEDATPEYAVALTMPVGPDAYTSETLHPIFAMNLPEGYVLARLRARLAKATPVSPMLLLARTSTGEPIGRVRVAMSGETRQRPKGEPLEAILAYKGAESVFAVLEERYLGRSAVSGMQPKLLVPGEDAAPQRKEGDKASLLNHAPAFIGEYIVKAAGSQFPGLAINEFVCMSIAAEADLPVPEFHLSEDREVFVMKRFDRTDDGRALGFEDFNTLMGRSSEDQDSKYRGSYEEAAEIIEAFVSPDHVTAALLQLFDTVALSCILGNGDAHLKNFGLLYTNPEAGDVRMSPVYDLTNTTAYLENDNLALDLAGNRGFFAGRLGLVDFGQRCGIKKPWLRVEGLIKAAEAMLYVHEDLLSTVPNVRAALHQQVQSFTNAR